MHARTAPYLAVSPARLSPSLAVWEAVTRGALAAERAGRAVVALGGYRRALALARQLIDFAPLSPRAPLPPAEDRVAALVASWHNLATLLAARGDLARAAAHLCEAHEAVVALYLDTHRDATLRRAALRHSRETHLALVYHEKAHGPHPLTTRALRAGQLALDVDRARTH
ncbi:hypothetical protein [Paraburkholderia acidisoli]|uniref:Tetratricopeptide repeat protein n=1 Tax=Paraburkholderia acidisoli TaxID=2571748 RepID=A0A7Z2GNN8_9BURK|nr:hypothetical protein [Paraburkholderia acidisoli]QGZ64916.1 hypothetical protein FAZ98_24235 [Paraburkholderia acidisoli]